MSAPDREPVGAVHEETARLFEALEGAAAAWARGERAAGTGTGDEPGRAGAGRAGSDEHLPTTCGACPVCLGLARLGRHRPEVLAHLTDAVQALGAALAAVTATPTPTAAPEDTGGSDGRHPRPVVETIEVTD